MTLTVSAFAVVGRGGAARGFSGASASIAIVDCKLHLEHAKLAPRQAKTEIALMPETGLEGGSDKTRFLSKWLESLLRGGRGKRKDEKGKRKP